MNKFPKFWYESNACWGNVESFEDLKEKLQLQLAENNGIDTIEDFLTKSKRCYDNELNFGTRREHSTDVTLKDFLIKHKCYEEFIDYCKQLET
jgi:hypothetical protein